MRQRLGILGSLSVIAIGVTVAVGTQAAVAQSNDATCARISSITTFEEFDSVPEAVTAFVQLTDPCHDFAVHHWLTLHHKQSGYNHS